MGTTSPILTWVPVAHAASYNVLLSIYPEFNSTYTLSSGTNSIYVDHNLYEDMTYFWKVRAINGTVSAPGARCGRSGSTLSSSLRP